MKRQAWLVTLGVEHVIIMAVTREYAKSHASRILSHDPDTYIVTPLTNPGEEVYIMGVLT